MTPRVHLLFKAPQVWWSYLAVISNPAIVASAGELTDVVCYDHEQNPHDANVTAPATTRYVRIFWDGISTCDELDDCFAKSPVAPSTKFFTIGINNCTGAGRQEAQPLYREGPLHFSSVSVRLAKSSLRRVRLARWKSLLVPARNIMRRTGSVAEALQLIAGAPRVVFCGSFGLHPQVLPMLMKRYSVQSTEILERRWCSMQKTMAKQEYLTAYLQDLAYLAHNLDTQVISGAFFVACVRLLDREYLIRHLEWAGVPIYTSQFGSSYIDVYSTPFYRQHLFLDFGSTVGSGNYPRSADLAYYRKRVLAFTFSADADELLREVHLQTHEPQMALRWQQLSSQVSRLR